MYKIYKKAVFVIALVLLSFSCQNPDFLDEKPLDIYTPTNSLTKGSDFQASINFLHSRIREIYTRGSGNLDACWAMKYATDFAVNATDYYVPLKLNDYKNTMTSNFQVPTAFWTWSYEIIVNSNNVIDGATASTSITDAEKKSFIAQAKFTRAWAYRMLGNLYGGVPIITAQITEAKRDYVRATRVQVYEQCRKDLTEAIVDLPNVDAVKDGKINKQAAQHLLSEIYICLNKPDEAIAAASAVINYSGVGLMTTRFGRRKAFPGDVYRDLFELGNQNRTSGNREGLFVLQQDYFSPANGNWDSNSDGFMANVEALTFVPTGGGSAIPPMKVWNEKIGGRGFGWIRPTAHFLVGIWQGPDFTTDMRNSQYNIIRDFQIDNVPSTSPDYGKWYVADGYAAKQPDGVNKIRNWYPVIKKATFSEGDFLPEHYAKDANGNIRTSPVNGGKLLIKASEQIFHEVYSMRLAETYLLRAEAYVIKGDKAAAAADINALRRRAGSADILASNVNIDAVLDERLRELYAEELRMLTLTRMGLLYDRNKRYNEKSGLTIEPYHNLWPIPFSEIERNVGAKLEQNPEYK